MWFIEFLKNHRVWEMGLTFKRRLAEELGFKRLERMRPDTWIHGSWD